MSALTSRDIESGSAGDAHRPNTVLNIVGWHTINPYPPLKRTISILILLWTSALYGFFWNKEPGSNGCLGEIRLTYLVSASFFLFLLFVGGARRYRLHPKPDFIDGTSLTNDVEFDGASPTLMKVWDIFVQHPQYSVGVGNRKVSILTVYELVCCALLLLNLLGMPMGLYTSCTCEAFRDGFGRYVILENLDVLEPAHRTEDIFWFCYLPLLFVLYAVYAWCTQSFLSTDDYDRAMRGLNRVRWWKLVLRGKWGAAFVQPLRRLCRKAVQAPRDAIVELVERRAA